METEGMKRAMGAQSFKKRFCSTKGSVYVMSTIFEVSQTVVNFYPEAQFRDQFLMLKALWPCEVEQLKILMESFWSSQEKLVKYSGIWVRQLFARQVFKLIVFVFERKYRRQLVGTTYQTFYALHGSKIRKNPKPAQSGAT
jgi:hypothetical protein